MSGTISEWERDRFEVEASVEIASIPVTDIGHVEPRLDDADEAYDRDLIALRSRSTSGLGVQLLLDRLTTQTFLTVTINGKFETFEIQPCDANEAFEHPYCYGATLPIR